MANRHVTVKGSNGKGFSLSEASLYDMEAHEKLTDALVDCKILDSESPELKPARDLLHRIQKRDFYKLVTCINCNIYSKMTNLDDKGVTF